jgi:hypothetical protein
MMDRFVLAAALSAAAMAAAPAQAVTLGFGSTSTSSNTPATGASATVDFAFADTLGGNVKVTLDIANTTGSTSFGAGATASKLTGIAFDVVSGAAALASSYLGSTFFPVFNIAPNGDTTLSPFGIFDLSFLDNSNFEGGSANGALAQGQSTSVSFEFDTALTAAALETAFFSGFSAGSLGFVARFQQVNAGAGSDKLSGGTVEGTTPIPLPAAGWLLLSGIGALALAGRRRAAAA